MSTQPIVIQIVDQVDAAIAVKINGIAASAHLASTEVLGLQAALAGLSSSTGLNNLASSLSKISPASITASQSNLTLAKSLGTIPTTANVANQSILNLARGLATSPASYIPATNSLLQLSQGLGRISVPARSVWQWFSDLGTASTSLGNRLTNLLFRIGGMELGIGRLGGALGGVATALLGPVAIALAAAIVAIASAVFIFERLRNETQKVAEGQAAIGKQFSSVNDKILQQHERLAALTSGPLAEYAQKLRDLPLQTIDVDFKTITTDLENQHSWWARIAAEVEHVTALALQYGSLKLLTPNNTQTGLGIRDAKTFLDQEQANASLGKLTNFPSQNELNQIVKDAKSAGDAISFDHKKQLEAQIKDTQGMLATEVELRKHQTGDLAAITDVVTTDLKKARSLELVNLQELLDKEKTLRAEAGKAAAEEQLKQFTEEMDRFKASVPGGITTAQDELKLRQQQLVGAPRPTAIPGLDSRAAIGVPDGGNIRKLNDDILKLTADINKQGFEIDNINKKYQDSIDKAGAYSQALQVQAESEKLIQAIRQKGIPIIINRIDNDSLIKQEKDIAAQGIEDTRVNREKVAVYNSLIEPINRYNDTLKATSALLRENAISADQAAQANTKAARAMQDAIDPLNEYKIGLQHEVDLLGQYGEQLNVATEIDRLRQNLQKQGKDLDQQSIATLTKYLTLLDQQKSVQADETRLWEENYGAKQKIYEQQLALNKAYFDGVINLSQWKSGALDAALATNKLNNEITGGTLKSNIVQLYGGLVTQLKGAHPVISALQSDFGHFFESLKKGFADSIAHVLVFGGSMKDALLNTARNAVAALLSSLIQLGIEFLIVTALSKLFHISLPSKEDNSAQKQLESLGIAVAGIAVITAVQLAAINTMLGPAWALAEAVSLFSFGANAAAATAGMAAVIATGTAAQTAGRFAEGGGIRGKGTGTSDDILIRASNGEFIVNARATEKHRGLLEAVNSNKPDSLIPFASLTTARFAEGGIVGKKPARSVSVIEAMPKYATGGVIDVAEMKLPAYASGGYVDGPTYDYAAIVNSVTNLVAPPAAKASVQMNVHIEHDGTTGVKVEHVDENTVRIIARQEAKSAVQTHAPQVVAMEVHNPNSPTSKALQRNYEVQRKR